MIDTNKMTKPMGNVIRREDGGSYNTWSPPEMQGKSINRDSVDLRPEDANENSPVSNESGRPTAHSLEEITKQAQEEGYQNGLEEGTKAGLQQQMAVIQQLESLNQSIRQRASEFDEVITQQLLDISIAIAKQVIRRELSIHPDEIMSVLREGIALMPEQAEQLTLKLHPDDAALVRETYDMHADSEISWRIFEDPSIQRGGCILSSTHSEINAELDQRIQSIVNRLLGGERSDD